MSAEVLGSIFEEDVGGFASSEDFSIVERLGDARSSPYPVYHNQ